MKKDKTKLKYIIIAALMATICLLLVFYFNSVYNAALDHFVEGEYDIALDDFTRVKFYRKSKKYIEFIDVLKQNNIRDDELLAKIAEEGTEGQAYKNLVTYIEGIVYFNNEQMDKASASFSSLGDFLQCKDYLRFIDAIKYFTNSEFDQCVDILNKISFDETGVTEKIRNSYLGYIKASAEFEAQHYYNSYIEFDKIKEFKDSAEKQKLCIQPAADKMIYLDSKMCSHDITMVIIGSSGYDKQVKVLDENGKLVADFYLCKDSSRELSLKAAYYTIVFGSGDNYFGAEDCFGIETGKYYKVKVKDELCHYYAPDYKYTIKLDATKDGSINLVSISYEDFINANSDSSN